jgi:hypothetical protein
MNFFQLNKLSYLHNGYNIFFCKTNYLVEDFKIINKLKNNVILITGNSDYPIVDHMIEIAPKNIKKWYAINCLANSKILEPIPLGLENKEFSFRKNHGVGHTQSARLKEQFLNRKLNINSDKFIYANFRTWTNPTHRTLCKQTCKNIKHIDLEENELPLEIFFNRMLEYKMVFCPIGNGIDTHRLWEVLYSNRIPIIIKMGDFKIYELYKKLPIIILDKIEDLANKDLIEDKLLNLNYNNLNMLDISYWINDIEKVQQYEY